MTYDIRKKVFLSNSRQWKFSSTFVTSGPAVLWSWDNHNPLLLLPLQVSQLNANFVHLNNDLQIFVLIFVQIFVHLDKYDNFLTHHSSPLTGRAQVPAQVFGFHNRDSAPTTQRSTRPWQPRESLWQNLSLDSLLIKSFSFSFRDSLLFKSPKNDNQTSVSFSFR